MKKLFVILMLVLSLALVGCESRLGSAGLGAAGGAAAGAGGYEYRSHQEMNRIEEARQQGRMSQEEYEIRRDQIQRMSIIQ
jgi:uncharacterized lipoprotein NlpE involved in copper resistance